MKTTSAINVVALAATLALSGQMNSGAQTWTNKANLLKQGRSMGVAVLNGKIYAVGGYCGSFCYLATTDEYNPATDTWTSKANMRVTRYIPAAAAVNGKLYAIGGLTSPGGPPIVFLASMEEYDPVGNTWTNKASMNQSRYAHQAVALNGKIYAIGGQKAGDVPLASVEEYDPASNTWIPKADMPSPRVSFGAVVANGKIYIVGGRANNVPVAPTHVFDPNANLWTTNASIPTTRETLGAAVVNGHIWVMGGSYAVVRATVEKFDPMLNMWGSLPDLPTARNECYANFIGNTLYVFGGYDNYSMQALVLLPPVLNMNLYPVLTIAGAVGGAYRIEATSDLVNTNVWTTLTNLTLPSSPYDFIDKSTPQPLRRFYRAVPAP